MKNFSRGKGYGGRERRDTPQMHKAICADCGRNCEVPFKPSRDKDVYCNNCFSRENNYREEGRNMYKATCSDCGRSCEVPFKPSKGKEIYCNDCFGSDHTSHANKPVQSNDKQDLIIAKLDKIIALLQSQNTTKEVSISAKPQKEEAIKKEIKKIVSKKESSKTSAKKTPVKRKAK